MTKLFRRNVVVSLGALCVGLSLPAAADTIYDNTHNDLSYRFNTGTAEVGNQVQFSSTGFLTNFSLEFWGTNTLSPGNLGFAGAINADVRLYYNDGAKSTPSGYLEPGTVLFDSGVFSLNSLTTPTSRSALDFSGSDFGALGGVEVTNINVTWTIQFSGMAPSDSLGLDVYSPPTVGLTYGDYWQRGNSFSQWLLLTNTDVPMSFGALFQATTVPEPSILALSALGVLGLFGTGRWLRRKS
jgi:PEP-CTERM motif